MFESFKKMFSEFGGEDTTHPAHYEENDYRLAAAALLVHAATIDGSFSAVERAKLRSVVQQRFDLTDEQTDTLVADAAEAEQQAIDLYKFTARLNRSLNAAGRARVVEMMWQVVCADGVITEFEDNMIWRAADLLGISRNERIALRERVMAAQRGSGG
jgi:uncharacterized tellurite resistance protein B-like protein